MRARTRTPYGAATSSGSARCCVGAVVGGLVIGLLVDAAAHTSPAFALAGVFLGIAVGCVGFWLRVRSALRH